MKTRTEVVVEMERFVRVVRHAGRSEWCSSCSSPVEMLSIDNAALLAHVSSLTIFRWAIAGELHSAETPEGLLSICPNSPKLSLVDRFLTPYHP